MENILIRSQLSTLADIVDHRKLYIVFIVNKHNMGVELSMSVNLSVTTQTTGSWNEPVQTNTTYC